jgi:hypothetical protein
MNAIVDRAETVLLVAAGVILAGLIMNYAYGKLPLIEDASDGFDM